MPHEPPIDSNRIREALRDYRDDGSGSPKSWLDTQWYKEVAAERKANTYYDDDEPDIDEGMTREP